VARAKEPGIGGAHRVTEARDRARVKGAGAALGTIGVTYGLLLYLWIRLDGPGWELPTALAFLLLPAGAVFLVAGGWSWRKAGIADDANYVVQKATPMPLRLVNEHDDVWLEGTIVVPSPIRAPGFSVRCAWYRYKEYELRSSGRSSHWEKVRERRRTALAWLERDGQAIRLDLRRAEYDGLLTLSRKSGRRKFELEYLHAVGRVSAAGVVTRSKRGAGRKRRRTAPRPSPRSRGGRPSARASPPAPSGGRSGGPGSASSGRRRTRPRGGSRGGAAGRSRRPSRNRAGSRGASRGRAGCSRRSRTSRSSSRRFPARSGTTGRRRARRCGAPPAGCSSTSGSRPRSGARSSTARTLRRPEP